jgi:hypothetical protein
MGEKFGISKEFVTKTGYLVPIRKTTAVVSVYY